jgi:nitrogen fixation protein FixH
MKRSRLWPGAIFGLIGLNMVVVAVTIYFAANDPSAAVEPQYYQKALAWDDTVKAREASARLGWRAAASVAGGELRITLTDGAGAPLEEARVEVTAYAVARAAERQLLTLSGIGAGEYRAPIQLHRAGIWEFRIEARRGADLFACTIEQEMGGNSAVASVVSIAGRGGRSR